MKPYLMFIGDEVLTFPEYPGVIKFPINTIGYWPKYTTRDYEWIEIQASTDAIAGKVWNHIPLEDVPKEYRVKALLMT